MSWLLSIWQDFEHYISSEIAFILSIKRGSIRRWLKCKSVSTFWPLSYVEHYRGILLTDWFSAFLRSSLLSAENTWDCGCDHAPFRHSLQDSSFKERFESLVDEPVMNCTTPVQMIGYNLASMNISWFPELGKTCLTPTTIWGTEQFRENRRSDLNLTCDIEDGYPQPLFNWTLPDGSKQATDSNWLLIENLNGNILMQEKWL